MSVENNELQGMLQGHGSETLPNAQAEDEIGGFFGSLDVGDLIEINRLAPIEHRGWLTALPFDPSIDIHSEIKRRYGGGTYSLKRRGRSRTGSVQWKRGSATITIAGEPILPAPAVVAPMPWQQPPQPMPWQQPAPQVDLQSRLLDILSSKLETPAQNLGEIIREIQQIIPMGAARPPGNAIDDLVASVKTARQLQELLASPTPQANPADDDDDEGEMNKMMKLIGMKIVSDLMGSKTGAAPLAAAPRPNPAPRMPPPPRQSPAPSYDAPPGWRKGQDGQWERTFDPNDCPPGWTRDPHTGRFRPVEVSMRDQRMDTGRFEAATQPAAPAFNGHPDDSAPAQVPLPGESGSLLQGGEENGSLQTDDESEEDGEGDELSPEEIADEILGMSEAEQLRVWQALQASGKLPL